MYSQRQDFTAYTSEEISLISARKRYTVGEHCELLCIFQRNQGSGNIDQTRLSRRRQNCTTLPQFLKLVSNTVWRNATQTAIYNILRTLNLGKILEIRVKCEHEINSTTFSEYQHRKKVVT